jgi:hypothetical protein
MVMSIDIPTLIHKLRTAPRKVGTFGRGDPNPLDEFAPLRTGEERDWLIRELHLIMSRPAINNGATWVSNGVAPEVGVTHGAIAASEIDRLKRTSGEG